MARLRSDRAFTLPSSYDAALLFEGHDGTVMRPRAKLVTLLVENREAPVAELAAAIGRTERTTRRYLRILCDRGVDGLLETKRATKLSDEGIDRLKALIDSGTIGTQRQVREWIEEQRGISYTAGGVSRLLKREAPVARRIEPQKRPGTIGRTSGRTSGASSDTVDVLLAGSRLLTFMNGLSSDLDQHAWAAALKNGLAALLPGSPLVRITLNTSSELDPQRPQRPGFRVISSLEPAGTARAKVRRTMSDPDQESTKDSLIRQLGKEVALKHYHPPLISEIFLAENVYLGSIITLYGHDGPDLREQVQELLHLIAPFLQFCLSDGIARQRFHQPEQRLAQRLLEQFAHTHRLTKREREVFMLHILDVPYNDIAIQQQRRPGTIKNQIAAIHRKTGTTSHGELMRMVFRFDS